MDHEVVEQAEILDEHALLVDPVLFRELPVIRKIIQDETWLEGERRGCHVTAEDRVVREKVCEVVLRIGQQLRDSISASITQGEIKPGEAPASVTHSPKVESVV